MNKGTLYIVATPIGNLADITFRALEILKSVDLILAEDTRHSLKLLNHFEISKPLLSYHKFNENDQSNKILYKLENGENIALISDAGTPGISDPGNIIIQKCIKKEISVVPIPGACAFIQALICSGFETNSFAFHGFLSKDKQDRRKQLASIEASSVKLNILYESPHQLLNTLKDLFKQFGDINVCVSKEITKIHETHFRNTLSKAIEYYSENSPKGEYVILFEKNIITDIFEHSMEIEITQNMISELYESLKDTNSMKSISTEISNQLKLSKNDVYNYLIKVKNQ